MGIKSRCYFNPVKSGWNFNAKSFPMKILGKKIVDDT